MVIFAFHLSTHWSKAEFVLHTVAQETNNFKEPLVTYEGYRSVLGDTGIHYLVLIASVLIAGEDRVQMNIFTFNARITVSRCFLTAS